MNIQAIWDGKVLRPTQPLKLKHDLVTIQVPDEEISTSAFAPSTPQEQSYVLPPEVLASARAARERLDAIRNSPLPPDEELPALTEKHLERIAAFELREDR